MGAPLHVAVMTAVEPELRVLALALAGLFGHGLGDFLSATVVGHIKDETGSLHGGVILMTWWILWGVLFWGLASTGVGYRLPCGQPQIAQ
eukprot:NODE_9079_length_355_cov_81.650000.p2 GENE.NODE_9079_length_355_cov_81.650000~~NODE_9079_length_355_cov_81.650000.p2  ORF type:complete len:90 (+),score=22.66 NODE_9079_length_355_cov_81.650000:3-272(+)